MTAPWRAPNPIESIDVVTPEQFERDIVPGYRPVVMRGLAREWPAVAAGKGGTAQIAAYLRERSGPAPIDAMVAPPSIRGRFFHADDMRGFNFSLQKTPIAGFIDGVLAGIDNPQAPYLYAGAAAADTHLPGFLSENRLPLPTPGAVPRIWIGGRSIVSTHYDLSDNVAVVVAGERRFTVFPPDQTENMYVGPLNETPAGQPVSVVDLREPDLGRYPRFADAMPHAMTAVLEPGDAIFIPSLWWHDIEATGAFNVLANYWYNHPTDGSAFLAFIHALQSVRDLPLAQRQAWRAWFNHFVFADDPHAAAAHLPPHARGIQGPRSSGRTEMMRQFLIRQLGGRP